MTIDEAKTLIKALEEKMTADAQAFVAATGLLIHSIPIVADKMTVTVRVKVQIPD